MLEFSSMVLPASSLYNQKVYLAIENSASITHLTATG